MAELDGFGSVAVVSPGGTLRAQFVPDANMVCASLTHRGDELLHTGDGVRAYAERGATMGIPLLHPWANRLAGPGYEAAGRRVALPEPERHYPTDPNGLPIHGVLPGLLRWEVLDPDPAGEPRERLSARLDYGGRALLELFPYPHELRLEITAADDRLTLTTTLRPTGDAEVPVSFGYHPYLVVPGAPRDRWRVTLGATERLVADARMLPTGGREPLTERSFLLGDMSWDDGLAGLAQPARFTVAAAERELGVDFEAGYRFAQVYAPPGRDLICFEPMTAPANALVDGRDLPVVAPGEEHEAAFTVTVHDN